MQSRLLNVEDAAAYCGVSPALFERHVRVLPLKFGRRKVWDVRAIDLWIDRQQHNPTPSASDDWLRFLDDKDKKGSRG
jgi:chromosome condensin MukBEF complex kleisin-like MukF subunit